MASSLRFGLLAAGLLAFPTLAAAASDCPGGDDALLKACRATESEARTALAKQISVDVETEVRTEQSRGSSLLDKLTFWDDSGSHEYRARTLQETSVILSQVPITSRADGQKCARICESELLTQTRNQIQHLLEAYAPDQLPDSEQARAEQVHAGLDRIAKVEPLVVYFLDAIPEADRQGLNALSKQLAAEKEQLAAPTVQFRVLGTPDQIQVDDRPLAQPGEPTALAQGTHTYRITKGRHCPVTGQFSLAAGETRTITADLADHRHPRVTFLSGLPSEDVRLTVGGEPAELGEAQRFPQCTGQLAYKFTLETNGRTDAGTVDLEPGLDTEVRADILTNADIRHLQKAASGNESGQSVAVSALRFAPAGDQAHVDAYYGGEALWLQNRDYLRYGPGIAGGQGGDSRAVEAFVHGRLQLNRMGAAGIPPHIGPVAVLPFAAVDLGLGYHEAGGEDQFADADAPWYREALRNHLVARARGGFEFSFHRSFSVTLHGGKHFLMDRAWTVGIGGTINLPERR